MGNKANPLKMRFGVESLESKRAQVPGFPRVTQGDVDLHGWNRQIPFRVRVSEGIVLEQLIRSGCRHWCEAEGLLLQRCRLDALWGKLRVYLRVWEPLGSERVPYYSEELGSHGNVKVLEESLRDQLVLYGFRELLKENSLEVVVLRLNALVRDEVRDFRDELLKRGPSKALKRPQQYREGCRRLALWCFYGVGEVVVDWISVKAYRGQLQLLEYVALQLQQQDGLPLKGFQLRLRGRLGGQDMASQRLVKGGRLPRSTYSAAVLLHEGSKERRYGLMGVQLHSYYGGEER